MTDSNSSDQKSTDQSSQDNETPAVAQKSTDATMIGWFVLGGVLFLLIIGAGFMINANNVAQDVANTTKVDPNNANIVDIDKALDEKMKAENKPVEILPGNPVVARFKGKALTRQEVYDFAEKYMGDAANELPKEQLFPIAVEQLVTQQVLLLEARDANIADQRAIKERIERMTDNLLRTEFLKSKVEERVTDAKMREIYNEQIKNLTAQTEIRARHILVDSQQQAQELITELDNGADFVDLAKEHSTGPTGPRGGDLGYFTKGQMVPEFENAAFSMKKGEYTKTPVKTQFGFHVVFVEDKREKQPPSFDQVKDQIKNQLMQVEAQSVLNDIQAGAQIEIYDINGNPKPGTPAAEGNLPADN